MRRRIPYALAAFCLLTLPCRALEVYLLRHGETSWNRAKVLQGTTPYTRLTEKGAAMAAETGEGMKAAGLSFDRVYASPLLRTRQTAELVCRPLGLPGVIPDGRLREMGLGDHQGIRYDAATCTDESLRTFYTDVAKYRPTGADAETFDQVTARALDFLEKELKPLDGKCGRVLCVTHLLFLKALLKTFPEDAVPDGVRRGQVRNCGVVVLELKDGRFALKEAGRVFYDVARFDAMRPPRIVAHRGARDLEMAETTRAACSNAVERAADIVRLDVRQTRDGAVVMGRDESLRLDEALGIVRPIPELWIDFKAFSPSFAERVLETVRRAGIDESRLMVVTPDAAALEYMQRRHPSVRRRPAFDIRTFGAKESDLLQTDAIQTAIDRAASAGGGDVVVPEGRFRTGGLVLRSGVTLRLEDGAELMGDSNPDNYPGSNRWYRALVRADGATDVGIVGGRHSRINGVNCYDPRGEEGFRGPHAIMLVGCTNVILSGYTVRDSANWAHALFHCGSVRISDVRVFGGHDAVDFHDSTDVTVENCELRTGDDCIAGFANRRCRVRDCILDTSCQAVRIGGSDILFERCKVVHPSSFGHRYGLPDELKRAGATAGEYGKHGMVAGVIYYCDTRWKIDRPQRDIVFRDCVFDRPNRVFSLDYDGRNMWCCRHPLESIAFERCTFKEVEKPISIYGDAERPLDFTLRDCTFSAAPGAEGAELLTAYNFGRITLENVKLEGFRSPRLVTRSQGEVVVKGGTPLERAYRPDPLDRTLTFAECAAALEKLPGDEAGWQKWAAERPTPPESRWSEEKGLYVTDDPLVVDVWGSALAVLRGETPHAAAISARLCRGYQYYVGWGRTGAVKPNPAGELSPLPAGAFGYAMAQDDPLFARTFFTDFVRSEGKTPEAVAGVRLALKCLTDDVRWHPEAKPAEKGAPREAVVYVSAHPDDLAGSVGTVIRLAEQYDVHVVEFTHGERGLGEAGYRDGSTARTRTAEDEAVCRALGVKLHWCGEIDGEAFAGRAACERIAGIFRETRPRAIIVHSLIETHNDHMMSASAAIKAAQLAGIAPEVYFQEQDIQSRSFQPVYWVDVSALTERRREIISLWACQNGPRIAERKIKTSEVNAFRLPMGVFTHAEVFGVFPGTVPPGKGIFDTLPGVMR